MNEKMEQLLWESGRLDVDSSCSEIPTSTLVAYREGRLAAAAAAKLEEQLAANPEARTRLAGLVGVEAASPPPEIRERVLARFESRQSESARRTRSASRRTGWTRRAGMRRFLQAAAVLIAGLGAMLWLRPPTLPPELAFDVQARGLAEKRSEAVGAELVHAYPSTLLKITAAPRGVAIEEVDFALYRVRDERIERVAQGPDVRLDVERGVATLTARAGAIVKSGPTTTNLFLVAARPGDLPDAFAPTGADARRKPRTTRWTRGSMSASATEQKAMRR